MPAEDAPDAAALAEGLRSAANLFLNETDLSMAVGEDGRLILTVETQLERGAAARVKGGVMFERRIELRSSNRRR